jgi:exopolysaccharide biosynthesis protein
MENGTRKNRRRLQGFLEWTQKTDRIMAGQNHRNWNGRRKMDPYDSAGHDSVSFLWLPLRRAVLIRCFIVSIAAFGFCASVSPMFGADTVVTNQLAQSVVYKHYHYDSLDGGKQEIYITDVNLNDPAVAIKFPYLTAKRTVTAHAGTVTNATVAVNGQFFDSSGSVQFLKVSNSVIYQSRAAVHDEQAVTDDSLGHTNSIGIALRSGGINSWTNSTKANVMACGVELVKNGVKIPDSGYDTNDTYVTTLNPRTCVAWTYDNHLLLMCVDGRTVNAHGMSIYQLRDDIFTRGSVRHAFGLDGGGSTEMWARGIGVCNVPSDGSERPVADAVVIVGVPPAPANLAATVAITNVSLSWSASAGATSYNLKRSTTNGGPYTTIVNRTTTSYTNTGLAAGTTFYYVVTALNGAGESSNSLQVAAATGSLPPAPGHLTATPGDSRVALGWDAVPGALSYHLKRSFNNGGSYVVIANLVSTGYTNTGLANGTTYYYVVSALNSAGEGTNSSQATAIPNVPLLLTGWVVTGGQLVINGSGGVTGQSFYVLGSTNVALPRPQWTRVATNVFGANGSFSFTNAINPAWARQFYMIQTGLP